MSTLKDAAQKVVQTAIGSPRRVGCQAALPIR